MGVSENKKVVNTDMTVWSNFVTFTKTQCDCVPLLHAVTGVSQLRSAGWSIPCAISYLMNRDLQIASHFT